jgi:hypothetical protein
MNDAVAQAKRRKTPEGVRKTVASHDPFDPELSYGVHPTTRKFSGGDMVEGVHP